MVERYKCTYAEFLLMAQEGKVRPRPIGPSEKAGDKWNPGAVPDEEMDDGKAKK